MPCGRLPGGGEICITAYIRTRISPGGEVEKQINSVTWQDIKSNTYQLNFFILTNYLKREFKNPPFSIIKNNEMLKNQCNQERKRLAHKKVKKKKNKEPNKKKR